MLSIFEHLSNNDNSIVFIVDGILIFLSEVQSLNEEGSIELTESGSIMFSIFYFQLK